MKRFLCIILAWLTVVALGGCSQEPEVELTFVCYGEDIHVKLEGEEAQKVAQILDNKVYDLFFGIPACGFDKDVSIRVNGRIYAIARDTCNNGLDYGNLRFFSVSEQDMEYIHSLFEKYGGYFPCI